MIEILSLPRRPHETVVELSKIKSGLPLNSLPGWEQIPLNSKLPMLKCPGNQVVFSKNKIGQSIRKNRLYRHVFDPSACHSFPNYNSLQDSNLKTFYDNERNLKRLRKNGEITQNNDVICNLKDFNEYRQQLHKSRLYYILHKLNRMEDEQHDRMLIANAEYITSYDHRNITARQHSYNEVLLRKSLKDQQTVERFKKIWETKQGKIAYIKMMQTMDSKSIHHQKNLRQLRMKKHGDLRNDLQRKQLISLKKLLQLKRGRLQRNMLRLHENRTQKAKEKKMMSWEKRLTERIANQDKIHTLLEEVENQKKIFIENHNAKYNAKWLHIQQKIKTRSLANLRKINLLNPKNKTTKNKSLLLPPATAEKQPFCAEFQGSFDKLLDGDVCKALNTALDLEDNIKVPFDADDPIYKAAQFIMQHILTKFHKDLSTDKVAYKSVYTRIDTFFEEAKKFIIFRSTQIISATRESVKEVMCRNGSFRPALKQHQSMGRVSFNKMSSTIGISSYEIHPLIEVREVGERKPTPAGSLASLVVDSTTSLAQKTQSSHLCRNELVFIEHYVTKFKRELIVGIGRRVFGAIRCHFENKIMDVRQELIEIDRNFLVKRTTKSILRYSINPLDFESNLRLCISALSSDIVWSLQKVLLKTARDPRRAIKPRVNCYCMRGSKELCSYCFLAPNMNGST